jgi:hypothetical protein
LRRADVFDGEQFVKQFFVRHRIEIQHRQRLAAEFVPAQRHSGNIDIVLAKHCPDEPHNSRTIPILQQE